MEPLFGYPTKLYVIGNGFDIHHKIKCKYSDFRKWLRKNRPDVYGILTRLYGRLSGDWWRSFEEKLTEFNPDSYPKKIAKMSFGRLQNYMVENYGGKGRNFIDDFQITMQGHGGIDNRYQRAAQVAGFEMQKLKEALCDAFGEWVKEIKIPKRAKKEKIDKNAMYFTFNYTRTLEDLYGIEEDQIIHLHGSVDTNEFIIGHNMTVEQMQERDLDAYGAFRNPDKDRGEGDARNAMFEVIESELKKPVDEVIDRYRYDFNALAGMKEIEVLGLSYSPIDLPYLRHILEITGKDIKVILGWHTDSDKKSAEAFAHAMKLTNWSLYEF